MGKRKAKEGMRERYKEEHRDVGKRGIWQRYMGGRYERGGGGRNGEEKRMKDALIVEIHLWRDCLAFSETNLN